jgi:hypothetical protein
MGIDMHALHLLSWASSKSNGLGVTATIGRQAMYVSPAELRRQVSLPPDYPDPQYCEDLLVGVFGAKRVDSFDNSDYEGCTHIADFNQPLVPPGQYDTVLDSGCLEHIYNVPQGLRNISMLCAAGGQILHCVPANNFCGHGFWQFSPELFFSLYSTKNGYSATQVFIADLSDESSWYEVKPPSNGLRVTVRSDSDHRLYVLCRTVKMGDFSHESVQQSDYVVAWSGSGVAPVTQEVSEPWHSKMRSRLKDTKFFGPLKWARSRLAAWLGLRRGNMAECNPSLIKRKVSDLS